MPTKNFKNKRNPDDRSDNVEKLQNIVHDTIENIQEAEDAMSGQEQSDKKRIREKNKRREEAIDGLRAEINDESNNQLM